tara:strand:- start:758 stop:1066 length:309 start_codon:yes stop_codon:yes gene_type:complete
MIKFAYFETGSNDALMVPVANYLGTEPINESSLTMHFDKVDNDLDTSTVVINFTQGQTTEAIESLHSALASNPKDGFIVVGDDNLTGFTNLEHITDVGAITL